MTMTHAKAAKTARTIVLALGVVYLALAVAGIVVVGWGSIREAESARLLGVFGVSRLLDVAHAAVGVLAVVAAVRRAPNVFAAPATIAFTAMAAYGVIAELVGDVGDPLHMTWWNVGLYMVTALTCVFAYTLRLKAR
jgi:Domain of unknown function (DUF4383)